MQLSCLCVLGNLKCNHIIFPTLRWSGCPSECLNRIKMQRRWDSNDAYARRWENDRVTAKISNKNDLLVLMLGNTWQHHIKHLQLAFNGNDFFFICIYFFKKTSISHVTFPQESNRHIEQTFLPFVWMKYIHFYLMNKCLVFNFHMSVIWSDVSKHNMSKLHQH